MLSPMRHEELVLEVARLRHLDLRRRRISEEAEAEARSLKQAAHIIGQSLRDLDKKIAHAISTDAPQETRDHLQKSRDQLIARLTSL